MDPHIEDYQGPARGTLRGFYRSSRSRRMLPPADMAGVIHEFDARVGGGYRMSLFYPPNERIFRGKTSDKEDIVNVRFLELAPPHWIVEAISFVTTDPAFFGEMTMLRNKTNFLLSTDNNFPLQGKIN
jgi:hypothetical protein